MSNQLTSIKFLSLLKNFKSKYFLSLFFGCRVNAAEVNQISQILLNYGLNQIGESSSISPSLIIVNTCSITQKGQNESIKKVRSLRSLYKSSTIIVTGCANLSSLKDQKNLYFLSNPSKSILLKKHLIAYSPSVKDKLTKSNRYLLNIQTGCDQFCTYCIVPFKRQKLWSLPIEDAIIQTKKALDLGFTEIIITGVNLEKYSPDLNNLLKALLTQTKVPLISFGSLPINCIDDDLLNLFKNYKLKIKNFLHIPIQSGSDKILKLMHRPYTVKKIKKVFEKCLLKIKNLKFGTDIIVGFPGESDQDFLDTLNLCKHIGFTKIHTFRYSPRPNTMASKLPQTVDSQTKKLRSKLIRSLICQTTLPSHQTP